MGKKLEKRLIRGGKRYKKGIKSEWGEAQKRSENSCEFRPSCLYRIFGYAEYFFFTSFARN